MTAPFPRATGYDVDLALRDAALHDLGRALGPEQAQRLYLTDTGFHFAVDALLHAGWWPHSPDIDTRNAGDTARARLAASVTAGMVHRADLLAHLEIS